MSLLQLHREAIQQTWLDAYGHLNEAYYLVPFTNATWKLQDHFGIGVDYFEQTHCAIYTVETHLRYLGEVRYPAEVKIESMILGVAEKKIWFAHQMLNGEQICASAEFMVLHYDTSLQETASMPQQVQQKLRKAIIPELPEWVGRSISLNR